MYAIEAQLTQKPNHEGDLLAVPQSGRTRAEPRSDGTSPESSRFERELATALEDLVHEDDRPSDQSRKPSASGKKLERGEGTAKDQRLEAETASETEAPSKAGERKTADGTRSPASIRESMRAALSDVIEAEKPTKKAANESKASDAPKPTVDKADAGKLYAGSGAPKATAKATSELEKDTKLRAADVENRQEARGWRADSEIDDEELELLPEADSEAASSDAAQLQVAPAAAASTGADGNGPGDEETGRDDAADRQTDAELSAAAGTEQARPDGRSGRTQRAAGVAESKAAGKTARRSALRRRESAEEAAPDGREATKGDGEAKNRESVERTTPRSDTKDRNVVELEVRDLRSTPEADRPTNDGEAQAPQLARGVGSEFAQDGDVQPRAQNRTISRAVLDNLAREARENLPGDIVRSARIILRNNNSGEVRLSLHPEELGRVRVQLQMQENSLMGRIVVDNAAVREVFEQNLPQLIRAFQDSGWETDSLDVTVADGEGGQHRDRDEGDRTSRRSSEEIMVEHRYAVEERGLIDVMA